MERVNKILFITLSNIGDVILTLPSLDALIEKFPESRITVVTGQRPGELFKNNSRIEKLIIYDKHAPLRQKAGMFFSFNKEKFDLVVDLRNTFFGAIPSARYRPAFVNNPPRGVLHMKDRHMFRVKGLGSMAQAPKKTSIAVSGEDRQYIDGLLRENNIGGPDKLIVVAAGARSDTKKWPKEKFTELIRVLSGESDVKIVLTGDQDDAAVNKFIAQNCGRKLPDLSGRTSLAQLASLLLKASLLITNDSATLHLGSYLDIPTLAVFGPTDDEKYGPWSSKSAVVKKDIFCRPCRQAQCRFATLECMKLVRVEDVLKRAVLMLSNQGPAPCLAAGARNFKRILIERTDRIGDVLLSTPVIKSLRDAYPGAFIAVMVGPYAKDVVEGNPYLDKVIVYDKDGLHKNWWNSFKFSRQLKKYNFDLAVILHPTNRAHLVTFLSGIKRRIGLDRKLGFLLTDKIKHAKQLGQKHELEYNLDLLKIIGIETTDKNLFMPLMPDSEKWAEQALASCGILPGERILAIHPAASCPSKIWPAERFAQVADILAKKFSLKTLIIASPGDAGLGVSVISKMQGKGFDFSGRTSLSQLASLLKRCALFISNDSGPVHMASAVNTPVISIFGRSQPGLSPRRWGPVGEKDKYLHKDIGCAQCLAHNCKKNFACLRAISVEEVVEAAGQILSR